MSALEQHKIHYPVFVLFQSLCAVSSEILSHLNNQFCCTFELHVMCLPNLILLCPCSVCMMTTNSTSVSVLSPITQSTIFPVISIAKSHPPFPIRLCQLFLCTGKAAWQIMFILILQAKTNHN